MTSAPTPVPFAGSDLVYFISPRPTEGKAYSEQPKIVVIIGWMGAEFSHLKHFSATHSRMYPSAMQFVILAESESAVGSRAYNLKRMRPVAEFFRKQCLEGTEPPSILFHLFSGGGVSQLIWLSHIFNATLFKRELGSPRPPVVLIFDSTPGAYHRHQYILGTTLTLSSGPRRTFVALRGSARWAVMSTWWALSGSQSTHSFIRDNLNDPGLLGWINHDALRVYIYSDADEVAERDEVARHAQEARMKGFWVKEQVFRGSGHVRHAAKDSRRYWATVDGAWRDAVHAKL
ncbi:hypothetical protein GGX14DRAFT_563145 [Mycena pura]|uniref:DUF829-domain-containing protein n=1 Tax=Mycena pura TaxID=153505 RepID=A0AAD6VMJ2_9AGAR|nr:hypothetical protein GGX14DRAFT_563145 [Mycena pura]